MENKTFLMDIHFWGVVNEWLAFAKSNDGYTAEDFTTEEGGVMEMIEEDLDDHLRYVWVDEGGYIYGLRHDLKKTAEEICKAVHELL